MAHEDLTLAVRTAAAHVVKDYIGDKYQDLRGEQLAAMNDLERTANVKSVTVEVPGIGDVATITLPTDKGGFAIADPDKFAVAVEAFHPDAIETVIRVKPDVAKRILANTQIVPGDDGEPVIMHVTKDGELHPLDGVRHTPPRGKGEASKFTMSFKKGDDPTMPTPKEQLLEMVLSGDLQSILTPPAEQPAIEAVVDAEIVDDEASAA